jgi:integrase
VLTLQWSQVDFKAGTVLLHAGESKNREAKTFPLTDELRAALEEQRRYTDQVA